MSEAKQDRSLDLDLETTGSGEKARQVVRVAVVGTWGLTRDGSNATITSDCASATALEREIARLHLELDDSLERGAPCSAMALAAPRSRVRAARSRHRSRERPRARSSAYPSRGALRTS